MTLRLTAVSFETPDPVAIGAFWGELLRRKVTREAHGVLVPGDGNEVGLRFIDEVTERPHRNRLHVHLTSTSVEAERQAVETALRLGGRSQGTAPPPIGRDVYLIDPDGNEFCVIEPTNRYLAGTGLLGEVTCNGTRVAGLFWREALTWAVVWDEGDQLAIQSNEGGTKIGWDTWPEPKGPGWNRQRLDLVASDLAGDVDRLRVLGATEISRSGDEVRMLDPDGSEFSITPAA